MEILGPIGGLLILGVLYALFVEGIGKVADTFKPKDDVPELPLTEIEEKVIEALKGEGYTFIMKNKYWIYLKDKDGYTCTIDKNGKIEKRFK